MGVVPDAREEFKEARQEIRKAQAEIEEERAHLTGKQNLPRGKKKRKPSAVRGHICHERATQASPPTPSSTPAPTDYPK
jgi:hypothetical protein